MRAGIAFDRDSDEVAEFGECIARCRPGRLVYEALSDAYEPLVPVADVRK